MFVPQKDHYFQRAKREGYLSRAVYKLIEIDRKYALLKKGMQVLDLGSAPGSWLQWVSSRIGRSGRVVGVDIQKVTHPMPGNVTVLQGDMTDQAFVKILVDSYGPFDVVLSDMAPFTTGNKHADSARSALLAEQALYVARKVLKPNGTFLVKIFQGSDFHDFLLTLRKLFKKARVIKPAASRRESRETYILGTGYKGLTE